jgi:hypothetical protein
MGSLKPGNCKSKVRSLFRLSAPNGPDERRIRVRSIRRGIRLQCLVLPAAERRGEPGTTAQRRVPPGEAEGGTSYSMVSVYLQTLVKSAPRNRSPFSLIGWPLKTPEPYYPWNLLYNILANISQPFILIFPYIMSLLMLFGKVNTACRLSLQPYRKGLKIICGARPSRSL